MNKSLRNFLLNAGFIKLYEIWVFYLYLKETWGQAPLPENADTLYSHNHYSLFWLIAEIAFFYILVRNNARKRPGTGMKLAQAGAIALYLPFMFVSKSLIPFFSLSYAIALSFVGGMMIYLLFSNSKYAQRYIVSFRAKPKQARA